MLGITQHNLYYKKVADTCMASSPKNMIHSLIPLLKLSKIHNSQIEILTFIPRTQMTPSSNTFFIIKKWQMHAWQAHLKI